MPTPFLLPQPIRTRGAFRRLLRVPVALALLAAPAFGETAPAEPAPEQIELARELGASGIELYESGAYPEAREQLEHAYRFVKVPTTGLWSARALDKTGDLVGAAARYREVLAMPVEPNEPQVFADARRAAEQELGFLTPRIPKLVIRLHAATASEVEVTLDGVVIAPERLESELQVNPGTRRIVGTLGERAERVTLDMPERSSGSAMLDFSPLPVADPQGPDPAAGVRLDTADTTRQTWGTIALAAGGAALVTGVVATVLASDQRNELDRDCPEQRCGPEFHADVDTLETTLTLSLVGYLGAAVGIGVGSYLLLSDTDEAGPESSDGSSAGWGVWLGPGSAGVAGRF